MVVTADECLRGALGAETVDGPEIVHHIALVGVDHGYPSHATLKAVDSKDLTTLWAREFDLRWSIGVDLFKRMPVETSRHKPTAAKRVPITQGIGFKGKGSGHVRAILVDHDILVMVTLA